tara:strand:+ start:855 stop:1232 length:378 start_codon:yes stop_codon:yes gene_type:complete
MIGDGRTDFDLSITIPNNKSRTNMKFNTNYARLSEYMNLDERLEGALKNQTKIIQDHNEIIIQIRGSIRHAIDTSRLIFALNKLEDETERKWEGNFVWYLDNEEISFDASNGFKRENKLWRRLDY